MPLCTPDCGTVGVRADKVHVLYSRVQGTSTVPGNICIVLYCTVVLCSAVGCCTDYESTVYPFRTENPHYVLRRIYFYSNCIL
jgi:hypothetical protein